MKKILTLALAIGCGAAMAQKSDNVGIGTTKPDPSALLDLNSNSKGFLLPRMSEAQRNAIKSPAIGLMIFQTDQTIGTYTYDGTTWQPSNARTAATQVAGAWDKQGNAIDGTDFLGSTNNFALKFKVNNSNYGGLNPTAGAVNGSVFLGFLAGDNIMSSSANVGIGAYALTGQTPVPANPLSGVNNLAVGNGVLYNNRNGSDNLGLGNSALFANTDGVNNVAMGSNSLRTNTTGSGNIAIGRLSLFTNLIGANNIAIGANAGQFATGSSNIFLGPSAGVSETGDSKLYVSNNGSVNPLIKGDFASNWLRVNSKTTGYLAIGDFDAATPMPTPTGYRLIVQDGILTEKLKVSLRSDAMNWADYVFDPSYKLMPLEEVEKYTKANKHLPNVPSADEITKEGIDVAKVSKMFMEKIEELTLHIIDLNKRIKNLEKK